ncbi:MAG TPA: F0F1 ATP synthase subunit A, partial [Vicinamibacterales bacterium]
MQHEEVAEQGAGGFNAGEVIIEHVSNSSIDHPLIHLPTILGVNLSVTKHVLMLWLVAAALFFLITFTVRRYLRQDRLVPSGFANALEAVVEFIRDSIVQPNVGNKWVNTWTPLLLTLFVFILGANVIGLIPVFDVLSLLNHTVIHAP